MYLNPKRTKYLWNNNKNFNNEIKTGRTWFKKSILFSTFVFIYFSTIKFTQILKIKPTGLQSTSTKYIVLVTLVNLRFKIPFSRTTHLIYYIFIYNKTTFLILTQSANKSNSDSLHLELFAGTVLSLFIFDLLLYSIFWLIKQCYVLTLLPIKVSLILESYLPKDK